MPRHPRNPDDQPFLKTFRNEESAFDRAANRDPNLLYTQLMIDRAKDALSNPNPFGMNEDTATQVLYDGSDMIARRRAYLRPIWEEAAGDGGLFPHLVEVADTAAYTVAASPETQLTFWALHEQAVERLEAYKQQSHET